MVEASSEDYLADLLARHSNPLQLIHWAFTLFPNGNQNPEICNRENWALVQEASTIACLYSLDNDLNIPEDYNRFVPDLAAGSSHLESPTQDQSYPTPDETNAGDSFQPALAGRKLTDRRREETDIAVVARSSPRSPEDTSMVDRSTPSSRTFPQTSLQTDKAAEDHALDTCHDHNNPDESNDCNNASNSILNGNDDEFGILFGMYMNDRNAEASPTEDTRLSKLTDVVPSVQNDSHTPGGNQWLVDNTHESNPVCSSQGYDNRGDQSNGGDLNDDGGDAGDTGAGQNNKGRKGRRKQNRSTGDQAIVPICIARLPHQTGMPCSPSVVYTLLLSRNEAVTHHTLGTLTQLFFGIASPEAVQQFRGMCVLQPLDIGLFGRSLSLRQILTGLEESEGIHFKAAVLRRLLMTRLIDQHEYWTEKIQGKTRRRTSLGHASPEVLEAMMSDAFPDLQQADPEYQKKYTVLKNKTSTGRHWQALKDKFQQGTGLLAVIPRVGPFKVSDSKVERLTDDVFERFLDVLIEYRGPFLQQIATKVSLTLDAMVNSAEFELADADPPPVLHLAYDSAELIGSCDIY